jgi:hypothetical protein
MSHIFFWTQRVPVRYITCVKICGQEFSDAVLERVRQKVEAEPDISRLSLSREVCEWMDWRRPDGKVKDMSCRVALLKLHREGMIQLPPPRKEPIVRRRESLLANIGELCEIKGDIAVLGGVDLVLVGSRDSKISRQWNVLMETYHYLGSGPLCGAQLRYLIGSERYGWLGGLAFSAAAWAVKARDEWIGWDDDGRRNNLQRVLCNSRFLIAPYVRVPNLASHVLSLSFRGLREDWQKRYGTEPVLVETFVDRERYLGTSYRAANWVKVGCTQGRGRQDRKNKRNLPVKDIYVYPLRRDARQILQKGSKESVAKEASKRTQWRDWAEEEFGGAELTDERLRKRLLYIARDMFAKPQANIPQACGSRAKAKAAYRFFKHEETTMEKLLRPHYESTWRRINEREVVLAVQDTTNLNYTTHPETKGLGVIGSKLDRGIGLILHNTMAFSTEGTPLGLLDVQCWARDRKDFGKRRQRHDLPIEEKESYKWLKSFDAAAEAKDHCRETAIVNVGDREADIYELFILAAKDPSGPKLLVRAERDRLLADGQGHLWEKTATAVVSGVQVIQVPRHKGQPAREAKLEIRYAKVSLRPPKRKTEMVEISLWAVLAQEIEASEGVEPLQWMLLSTAEVKTFEDAVERLAWYALRWGIEVYHRTLKSGCKIEERQFADVNSIEACLALDMVVAWRIFHLTKLGREIPDVPCTVFFEDAEWKALVFYKTQNTMPPENPPTLREATRMVASLGGFLGRKGDGEPGTKNLWLGIQRLDDIAAMWKYMAQQYAPHLLIPAVSRSPGCG